MKTRAITLLVGSLLLAGSLQPAPAQTDRGTIAMSKTTQTHAIERSSFGTTKEGEAAELYTLTNKNGLVAKITTYGATLTELLVPDRKGQLQDVVLGFDDVNQYEQKDNPYFGATVGRYCNRIGGAQFELDGTKYSLAKNDHQANCLHGGLKGFNAQVWKAEPVENASGPAVRFTHVSKDMEEGFPGNLTATVTYILTDDNALEMDYAAKTDKPTPVNLTNHTYFNLLGAGKGDVLKHQLTLAADSYTPVDDKLIPTGEIKSVKGTPLDFTVARNIGDHVADVEQVTHGYDHNFVLSGRSGKLNFAARVIEPSTGRSVEVFTTEPGVQLYTGNWLDGSLKGQGGAYHRFGAFCLETQHFPDSPNKPSFPSTILRPGQEYKTKTIYKFSVS